MQGMANHLYDNINHNWETVRYGTIALTMTACGVKNICLGPDMYTVAP